MTAATLAHAKGGDVREGGRWSFGQRLKNDALFVLVSGVLLVTRHLPGGMLGALGRALGLLAWGAAPGLRRLARDNVQRALPELDAAQRAALVRRTYGQLGTLLGETAAALDHRRPVDPLPLLPGSRECLAEAVAEGRGVVFASAHLGPWERVAASLVAAGFPLTVVAREPYDPRLSRVYERLRADRGVCAVYRGRPGAATRMVRVLRAGGILGIPMDLRTRAASIDVPFFGVPAPTPVGPARLALRTGAAVVVGTVAPDPSGGPGAIAISFVRLATAQATGTDVTDLSARINAELSARIRALPDQWPWMHRRWR
jgi:KDO2-lipid IV(A) lauroyltransferase